ncbi:MAG: hypothetical protein ABI995_15420, partial [Acidobacteriota bacterium]
TGTTPSASATNGVPQPEQINAAVQERPSDRTLPGAQSFQGGTAPPAPTPNIVGFPNGNPAGPLGGFGLPGGLPQGVQLPGNIQSNGQIPGQPTNPGGFQPQFPGQQFPGQTPPSGTPNTTGQPGFQPQFPGQQFPGQANPTGLQQPPSNIPAGFQLGPNGQLIPAQIGGTSPFGGPNGPTTPGLPPNTPATNAGLSAIQQILTTPRAPPAGINVPQNNSTGGGIAGVASTHTGPSIKVYKERQKYEEWEFIFTPTAGAGGAGGATGAPGPNGQPGQPRQPGQAGQPGQPGQNGQPSTGFGTTGFGATGFGTTGLGAGGAGGGGPQIKGR